LAAQKINPFANATNQTFYLAFYVLIGFVNFVLGYVSFTLLPLGDASALVLSAPIYTCFLAWLLLKEQLHWLQMPVLTLNVLGVICLCRPTQLQHLLFGTSESSVSITSISPEQSVDTFHDTRLLGVTCALLAATTSSVMFVTNRLLRQTPVSVILWWWALGSAFLALIAAILFRNWFSMPSVRLPATSVELAVIAVNVITAIVAQFLLTVALKVEKAGPISVIRSSDIALAFLLQLLFVPGEQSLNWFAVIGALLILMSVVATVLQTTRSSPSQPSPVCSPSCRPCQAESL
jgi:drug/metabolite transporter (DMT)-like permease